MLEASPQRNSKKGVPPRIQYKFQACYLTMFFKGVFQTGFRHIQTCSNHLSHISRYIWTCFYTNPYMFQAHQSIFKTCSRHVETCFRHIQAYSRHVLNTSRHVLDTFRLIIVTLTCPKQYGFYNGQFQYSLILPEL